MAYLAIGIITRGTTLATTTAQAVKVSCEFDVPVRFDMDDMELELRTFASQCRGKIRVIEVRS